MDVILARRPQIVLRAILAYKSNNIYYRGIIIQITSVLIVQMDVKLA